MKKLILKAVTEKVKGKLVAIASTETEDRSGDSLKIKDWDFKDFKQNPVLQAGHDYRPQYTIGIAKNLRIEDKKVLFEPVFHTITTLAKDIKEMYEKGFLKAWSVGFIPADVSSNEKHQLLEISAVAVPANAEALTMSFKSVENLDEKKEAEISSQLDNWIKGQKQEKEVKEEKDTSIEDKSKQEKDIKVEKPAFKERWNKSLPAVFNKDFDMDSVKSKPSSYSYDIYTKYLNCKVKDIYLNSFAIPSPLIGSYLAGFKEVLDDYKLVDERNFDEWKPSGEKPLMYEVIQLNSKEKDDFLIEGTKFCETNNTSKRFIVKFYPTWCCLMVDIVSTNTNKTFNKDVLDRVGKWVDKNNKLKGEIFGISGEFLKKTSDKWDDLVLPKEILSSVQKGTKRLNDKKAEVNSRGLLFVGPPGTGKTKTGKVMMNDLEDSTFIWVSTRDLNIMNTTTEVLKTGFSLARKLAPSVLFLEDIDQWFREFTIDLLKTEMDGLKENKGMITVLTSNNPETLPDALLDRPGRFHDVLEFGLPTKELRADMIKKWIGDIEKEVLEKVLSETEGFSGAHMKELVDFATMIKEDDNIEMPEALLQSLEKLKSQRELIKRIREKENITEQLEKKLSIMEIEMKEGRVISTKNRKAITTAIETTKKAIAELEKLLELSDKTEEVQDTPKSVVGSDSIKKIQRSETVKTERKVQGTKQELMVRILQNIAKETNHGLYKIKR